MLQTCRYGVPFLVIFACASRVTSNMDRETTTDQKTSFFSFDPSQVRMISKEEQEKLQKICESTLEACRKQTEEKERLSLFNKDGSIKNQEEITKIGIERQWKLVAKWLDEKFGYSDLLWVGGHLFQENIDRLEAMHFKCVENQLSHMTGHYKFKFNPAY